MIKKLKNEKAITLIALVVTIIVLIILASISINLVLGENGIITKAKKTRDETDIASQKEQISLAYLSATTKTETTGGSQIGNLRKELKKSYEETNVCNATKTNGDKGIKVYIKDTDKYFFIDNTGNVTNVTKEELESKPPKDVYAALYKLEGTDNPEDLELVFYSLDNGEKPSSLSSKTLIAPDDENQNWNISNEFVGVASIPWYSYVSKIREVTFANEVIPVYTSYWFVNCTALKKINNINNLNTCNVTTMACMFYRCSAITELDLNNFDTSNVTDMIGMFQCAIGLKELDLSSFDTSKVKNMRLMFAGNASVGSMQLEKIIGLDSFDTGNCTDMAGMFQRCSNLIELDVSSFNTANVTNMSFMFNACSTLNNLDVSNFNTANVTDMMYMFNDCFTLANLDVSNFNTAKVTNMSYMFNTTLLETLDLSNFDTRNVTTFKRIFNGSTSLKNIYVGENWNTEKNTEETIYVFPTTCYLPNFSSSNDEYRDLKWAYVGEGGYLSTKPTE